MAPVAGTDDDDLRGSSRAHGGDKARRLGLLGLVGGAWAILPRFAGPDLRPTDRVEIADHVVPGLVVIALSLVALWAGSGRWQGSSAMLSAGLTVLLAGCWMVATHVPLLAQAARDEVGSGAALFHNAPRAGRAGPGGAVGRRPLGHALRGRVSAEEQS